MSEKPVEFEAAMRKLEDIVASLESGELSLEEALKQYEEGVKMADLCTKRLTEAEKRVEVLLKSGSGKFRTENLDEAGPEKKKKK